MTCSICKGANHNKRSCPKNPKHKSTPTPTQESQQSSTGNKRGRGQYERASSNNTCKAKRRGAGSGYKRSRVVRQGDIGYQPTKGLKWKGKQATTQRELQVRSVMHCVQTRSSVAGIQTRAQVKEKSPLKKTS